MLDFEHSSIHRFDTKGPCSRFLEIRFLFYLGAKTFVVCNRKCRLASFLYVIQKVQHCYVPARKKGKRIFALRLARVFLSSRLPTEWIAHRTHDWCCTKYWSRNQTRPKDMEPTINVKILSLFYRQRRQCRLSRKAQHGTIGSTSCESW